MWSIDPWRIKKIRSYEEAKEVFAATKPWRGEDENMRPIAERRAKHKCLVYYPKHDEYACRLYRTDVVTYGRGYVRLEVWDSKSTVDFAGCVAPRGCYPISHQGAMFWDVQGKYVNETTTIRLDEMGKILPFTFIPKDTNAILNREKAKEIRESLQPYILWRNMTNKLVNKNCGYSASPLDRLVRDPGNMELYPAAREAENVKGPDNQKLYKLAYRYHGAYLSVPRPAHELPRRKP